MAAKLKRMIISGSHTFTHHAQKVLSFIAAGRNVQIVVDHSQKYLYEVSVKEGRDEDTCLHFGYRP